jgi:hypothetical protein
VKVENVQRETVLAAPALIQANPVQSGPIRPMLKFSCKMKKRDSTFRAQTQKRQILRPELAGIEWPGG